jgi:hypothetical protein
MYGSRIFWISVCRKEGGLGTYKPSSVEFGGYRYFLYLAAWNFELGLKILDKNLKFLKHI